MSDPKTLAVLAADLPARTGSGYPQPFADRVAGRSKQALGNGFRLTHFGINRTTLPPGCESALLHRHTEADEFIYILDGTPTLVTDQGEMLLAPGMCAGFPAGGVAHHLVNRSDRDVIYLEIGDRIPTDEGLYPNDDLHAVPVPGGGYRFQHKDGTPY